MTSIRWAFNVKNWKPTREQWKLALECLQKEEADRCDRFVFLEDCKSSLIGRLLMRKAVSECLGLEYDKIKFSRTESGKPYINGFDSNFSFNISHNGDYCVLASELDFKVGVDVMKVEHRGASSVEDFLLRMKKQFSSYEWNYIFQPGLEVDKLHRFYRLWCLKESYVKAIGTGIAFDLQTISFSCKTAMQSDTFVATDTDLYLKDELMFKWTFEESLLDKNHCITVALLPIKEDADRKKRNETPIQIFHFLDFDNLMENCKSFEKSPHDFWEKFKAKSEKKY